MREQVIAARSSRQAAGPARGFAQRPARRESRTARRPRSSSVRAAFRYVPSALKLVAVILGLITVIVGYRVAASASLFQVRNVDVTGTSRTSADEIGGLVRRAVARTGVWRADLPAISTELERLPGVRRAVVTRVLPDRLRVRVTERLPVAVVRTSVGHFVWVDDEAVALGEMKSADPLPPFFIRGWNEDGTEEAGAGNIERVQKYLELARDWQTAGLVDRVSEVNLVDVRDVRAQLAGNDSQIEVRLGGQDPSQRLKSALDVLDQYKRTPRGSSITYVDSQGGRVILGFTSGNKMSTAANAEDAAPTSSVTPAAARVAQKPTNNSTSRRIAESGLANTNRAKPSRNNSARDQKNSAERPRVYDPSARRQ